ncbi:sensor histidine kinase [Verrucomicrobiota bacterium sgz303538]
MSSPRHLSLLQKGLILIAIPLVYQAILLGALLARHQAYLGVQEKLVETKNVLLRLDEIFIRLLRSQGDLRGYLLTGQAKFRESALDSASQAQQDVAKLVASVPYSSHRAERIPVLRKLIAARIRYNEEIVMLYDQGKRDEAIARVQRLEGQQLMEQVQQELTTLRAREEQIDEERTRELQGSARSQNLLLVGGLVLNVLVGAASVIFFSKNVGARLERLSDNMRCVARGEVLPPHVGGEDEIGELDNGLHAMAKELADAHRNERAFQQALEKRNAELTRANRELDHKNQENEMFVYSVSHDLRSPLVNLQGFSKELGLVRDDLRQLFEGELNDKARARGRTMIERDITESIHYIQTAVTRLSAIIDALLRLSRIGRVEYRPEIVYLKPVINRIISAMRSSIDEKGATVSVSELPPVWGDPTALEQIFANLIANAVNYLSPERPGQIEVGILKTPPEDLIEMQVFFVKDNGLGIAEAYLPKVFAIFQRLHGNVAQGEGIGLALVRRMVERHGGKIWVDSVEGVGSTFFVSLPHKADSPLIVAPKKERIRVK